MTGDLLTIAIDGPVASGKGLVAGKLAQKLDILYIYTGAMYRALALACVRAGVSLASEEAVVQVLREIAIDMQPAKEGSVFPYTIMLNDEDVTEAIQEQAIAQGASDVGVFAQVRQWMVERQKQMAQGRSVVMEGRDIALRVLPDADIKIYLTASLQERAKRRFMQWQEKGLAKTLDETIADTKIRDMQDTTRSVDPLQKVSDAWELDTTAMTPDQVVDRIIQELRARELL
jgi:cytidylate kinase